MKLTVTHNFPEVQAQVEQLREELRAKVAARAVNRTMEQGRTVMSSAIRERFALKASRVREALVIRRASFRGGVVYIEAALESPAKKGRSLNLINFAARETRKGVSVKILKAGPRKVIEGAFIGNNGRTVFIREGDKRLPIRPLQTVDVAQMFNTRTINAAVVRFIEDKLPEVFAREAKFALDQFNARRAA